VQFHKDWYRRSGNIQGIRITWGCNAAIIHGRDSLNALLGLVQVA
jgi:hypothetical protein